MGAKIYLVGNIFNSDAVFKVIKGVAVNIVYLIGIGEVISFSEAAAG